MEEKIKINQSCIINKKQSQSAQKQQQQSFSELNQQISHQLKKNQKFIRNFWVLEEDNKLRQLVQKYGVKKWTQISSLMSGRSAKRCRQRWMNYLDTGKVKTAKWSEHQKWILYLCYIIHGNKWSTIATILNRGDNIVKNQINSLRRKKMFPFEGQLREILKQPSKYLESQKIDQQQCSLLKQIMALQGVICVVAKQAVQLEKVQLNSVKQQQKIVQHNRQNVVKREQQERQINSTQQSDRRIPSINFMTQNQPFWWNYHCNYPFPVQFSNYEQFLAILNGINEIQRINCCFMSPYN